MSKRVPRFGRDMMPRKEKAPKAISKKPRPFRKMKMPNLRLETLSLKKEIGNQSSGNL